MSTFTRSQVAAVQQTWPSQVRVPPLPQSMLHRLPAQRDKATQASGPWQEMAVLPLQALLTPPRHEFMPEQLALQSSPESTSSPAQEPVPLQRTMHDPVGQ